MIREELNSEISFIIKRIKKESTHKNQIKVLSKLVPDGLQWWSLWLLYVVVHVNQPDQIDLYENDSMHRPDKQGMQQKQRTIK